LTRLSTVRVRQHCADALTPAPGVVFRAVAKCQMPDDRPRCRDSGQCLTAARLRTGPPTNDLCPHPARIGGAKHRDAGPIVEVPGPRPFPGFVLYWKIVKQKCDRFQAKLRDLKPTTNPFDVITQPEEQIRYILREAQHFVANMVGAASDAVDVSVMRRDPYKQKWHFVANTTTAGKPNTKPERLMNENSIARKCIESGEELFVADKETAAGRCEYYLSDKDRLYDSIGSAFCGPLWVVTNPDNEAENQAFVVTFVTYGVRVCEAFDQDAEESVKTLFREFVRRIEVECTLLALKKWRAHHHECKKDKAISRKRGVSNENNYLEASEQQDHEEQDEVAEVEDASGTQHIVDSKYQVPEGKGNSRRPVRGKE